MESVTVTLNTFNILIIIFDGVHIFLDFHWSSEGQSEPQNQLLNVVQ